jgi:hypothetical protein
MEINQDDYDSPWKDILEVYFEDFMRFFFPVPAQEIDWSKAYTFIDTELQKIVRDSELGKRFADRLARVWRKNGEEAWILIHVEIQGYFETDFAKRLYIYNYRIFDRFGRHPISLAVFADENRNWKPDRYTYELWGYKVDVKFPSVKLLDYGSKWEELEASKNPFAIVVMAHLKTKETKNDHESRGKWKITLSKMLYDCGYKREDIINLFEFIDWLMRLPEELDNIFWQEIAIYEEDKKMPYITSVERIGIKKGLEQGLHQGLEQGLEQGLHQGLQQGIAKNAKESVIEILGLRFGYAPASIKERIDEIKDVSVLKKLHRRAVTEASIEDFELFFDTDTNKSEIK